MQTPHTPGPWFVDGSEQPSTRIYRWVYSGSGETVAEIPVTSGGDQGTSVGNAHLIASAPKLLAALDQICGQAHDAEVYGELELRDRMAEIRRLARMALREAQWGPK